MANIEVFNDSLEDWSKLYLGDKAHCAFCDPPYFLHFMASSWDMHKDAETSVATAKGWGDAMLPHLHPGALVFMFSSPRTQHYLMMGMEQAGFYCFDVIMYCFGSGFPKSQSTASAIEKSNPELAESWKGYRTRAFKPAYEPLLCFVAPDNGDTYAELALKYGTGSINIDGGRIPIKEDVAGKVQRQSINTAGMNGIGKSGYKSDHEQDMYDEGGRFPANIIHDGSDEVINELDKNGESGGGFGIANRNKGTGIYGSYSGTDNGTVVGYGDSGGASRFFYTAKVQTNERDAGLDNFETGRISDGREIINDTAYNRDATLRKNTHPTLKPIELCKYVSTLLLPPSSVKNRRILIPFAGAFSEVIGAELAGFDEIVAIEREKEYIDIGEARYKWWKEQSARLGTTDVKSILGHEKENKKVDAGDTGLMGML